jgi:predicted RecB family endonuclease
MLTIIFYFLFGYVTCLFFSILNKKNKSVYGTEETDYPIYGHTPRFYVNIFLTNRKEVIENMVRKNVSRKRPVLRALAKRLAVNLVSDESLAAKVANDLIKTIPSKLSLIGARAVATIAYTQSAYICIEVEIPSVDIIKLIEVNSGSAAAAKLTGILAYIGLPVITNLVESLMARVVCKKVMTQLPQTIQEKLEDKLIAEVDIIALSEEEQGPFLINTIQQLNSTSE